jgi:hypothetical protein
MCYVAVQPARDEISKALVYCSCHCQPAQLLAPNVNCALTNLLAMHRIIVGARPNNSPSQRQYPTPETSFRGLSITWTSNINTTGQRQMLNNYRNNFFCELSV